MTALTETTLAAKYEQVVTRLMSEIAASEALT